MVILAFAVYPQVALERSERDARRSIIPAQAALVERDGGRGSVAGVTP